ncbi:MAG: aquaporin, partial [Winogradskyella sp.]|nr:aquaporin [Winogradskyella sp.]
VGAIAAAAALYLIVSGKSGFETVGGFAANGFGDLSPDGYNMVSALVAEIILTAFFLLVILGSTNARAPKGFAPIAIGLALTLIHLISIPITNTSVNPARSLSQAIFAEGAYLSQVWLFWVAPIVGAIIGGIIHKTFFEKE